jgi:WD40 repeat protein
MTELDNNGDILSEGVEERVSGDVMPMLDARDEGPEAPMDASKVHCFRRRLRNHRLPVAIAAVVLAAIMGVAVFAYVSMNWERNDALTGKDDASRQCDPSGEDATRVEKAEKKVLAADRDSAAATQAGEKQRRPADVESAHEDAERRIEALAEGAGLEMYRSGISGADRLSEKGMYSEARALLDTLDSDLRGWEYGHLMCRSVRRNSDEPLTLKGHSGGVLSVAFSPDGKRLASGSADKTIKLWDTGTGTELLTLKGHLRAVTSVDFSPDGRHLASGSEDSSIILWDTVTGKKLLTLLGHAVGVHSVDFSPDGKRLASGSRYPSIILWDTVSGKKLFTLTGHMGGVRSVAFSPDGRHLTSAGSNKTIRLWDTVTGKKELFTRKGHSDHVHSVAFLPDCSILNTSGMHLASGSMDKTIKLWNIYSEKALLTLEGHSGGVYSIAFSPHGKRLASGSHDKTIKLWDVATGEEMLWLRGHKSEVLSVAFSPDGKRLASGSVDKTIKLWETATGKELLTLKGHSHSVDSVALSPDGKRLASGSGDDTVKLWDAVTGKELLTFKGHSSDVSAVAFSSDGTHLASGSRDNTIKLWDAAVGKQLLTLTGHSGQVYSVSFSPGGKRLASGSRDKTVKLWNTTTGKEMLTFKGHSGAVLSVAFSPDGKHLASGGEDRVIRLYDTVAGRELLTLRGHASNVLSVAFSPDGRRLASASYDQTIKLWDVATRKELLSLKGHSGGVYSVAFSPDGKRLVSGSHDKTIKLWDTVTREELLSLKGHSGGVYSVAFSPDGNRIVSVSGDNTVKLWDTLDWTSPAIICLGLGNRQQMVSVPSAAMRFVRVSPGSFVMGCPDREVEGHNFQKEHKVKLTKGFHMGVHEVTQEQYKTVMGANPSRYKGENNPVDSVSWKDAVVFCERMSLMTGHKVRLPTDAEWEYACRAGTTTRFSFGDKKEHLGDYAWYAANGGRKSHPVGQKKPNRWGFYDMHGNVIEWVSDRNVNYSRESVTDPIYTGGERGQHVWRGGSWIHDERGCRSAQRTFSVGPHAKHSDAGFRVVCIPNPDAKPQVIPAATTKPLPIEIAKPLPIEVAKPQPIDMTKPRHYIIKKSDSIWSIAEKTLGTGERWEDLVKANPGLNPKKLSIGRKIVIPSAYTATDTRIILLEVLRDNPGSEKLRDVVKLWASEAANSPNEKLFRQTVTKLGEGEWQDVLLDSLNTKKFFAKGSALELLASRSSEIDLPKRLKIMTAKTASVKAMQVFSEKFGYIPALRGELMACVALHADGEDSLDAPARLAKQWSGKYEYQFNIRDLPLLSALAVDPLRTKIGRDELIKRITARMERRKHVARWGKVFKRQVAGMTMADLWNITLLDEMLCRKRTALALKVLSDRLRSGLAGPHGGLVFYEKGKASATLYPQSTDSTRGDREHVPEREFLRAGSNAICHFHTRFKKVYNDDHAGVSQRELLASNQRDFYGLVLARLDSGTFGAFYYNPGGQVVSLGLYPLGTTLATTKPAKPRPAEVAKPKPIGVPKPPPVEIVKPRPIDLPKPRPADVPKLSKPRD